MIKNYKIVQKFEEELIKKEKVNIIKNFQIMDAMYKEARALGVIPMKDPLKWMGYRCKDCSGGELCSENFSKE